MADIDFFPVQSRTREVKLVTGSILPNGSSALAASTPNTGDGFTAARTSKGCFTLTLEEKYPAIASARAALRMAGAHSYKVNVGAVDVASARTVVLYVESVEPFTYNKAQDAAANTTTSETIMGRVAGAMPIGHTLYFSPQGALTADDTNYATITISKRTAGGAATTVATAVTNVAGTGSWTAFSPVAVTLTAAVAADDVLTITVAKAGTGVQIPNMVIQAAGLQDIAASSSNVISFILALENMT